MSNRSNSNEDNAIKPLIKSNGRNRFCGAGSSLLKYPRESVLRYVAGKWCVQNMDEEWLSIDKAYVRYLADQKILRKKNPSLKDVSLADFYLDRVEHGEKGSFEEKIYMMCHDESEGVTGELEYTSKVDKYTEALRTFVREQLVNDPELAGIQSTYTAAYSRLEGAMSHEKTDGEEDKIKSNEFKDEFESLVGIGLSYVNTAKQIGNRLGRTLAMQLFQDEKDHTSDNSVHRMEYYMRDVSFVAVDYRYGMKSNWRYLNSEDVASEGKDVFEEIKKFYPEIPVYVWEQKGYTYSREECISLTSRGAEDILTVDFSDYDKAEEQIDQLLVQLWQQKSLDNLAAKHQVLTYETAQQMSESGENAVITVYNLKLSTAVDAEEQNVIVSAEEKPNIHWDDIVVNRDAKDELKYFQQYLKNPKEYLSKGAKAPKGILMYGPPGTGKTTLAKVMATESDVTFLSASADQFISKWAGEGPQAVHHIFSVARKYAPAILFIDEIDAIGCRRNGSESHDGKQEILNALLTEMDGFKVSKNKPVLVMAATNLGGNNGNTGALDPALVRRFDRSICIDLPDKESRIKLIKLLCKRNPIIEITDNMIENLSERSIGMSPALIEGAVNAAIREAIRTETVVTDQIVDEAFEKYNNGEEKQWAAEELIKTARHEAGHAFLSYYFGNMPSYLTIVARDNHGGYMLDSGNENKGSYSKKDLLEKITVALGGRAAELIYYGDEEGLTTGPSGDLQTATSIVYRMICNYAMYEEITQGVIPDSYRDSTEIKELASKVLKEQLALAMEIIKNHCEIFDVLVDELMNKTHLNRKELGDLLMKNK